MQRVYVFKEKARHRHYQAVFAIRCFDNRFWWLFKHFIKHMRIKDLDPESVAGGAKVIASPEKLGDRDFILREIEKSIHLHKTKRVLLFTHSDCGAYGGLARFSGDRKKELRFHSLELKKARARIRTRFPKMRVDAYFLDRDGVLKIR